MLSEKQRRTALKKTVVLARGMALELLADGVDEITLTHYGDEGSFRAMKLPEEGDDFEHRQHTNAEVAKVMVAHGLDLKVQVLNAEEYFTWLGARSHTYQTVQDYPGGKHVLGDEAEALLGINENHTRNLDPVDQSRSHSSTNASRRAESSERRRRMR